MDIKLLKSDILSNNIPKFLIFIEEEPALSRQYIHSISNTLNKAYKYYDTADEVLYDVSTDLRNDYVYVIYNDDKILKKDTYIDALIKANRNIIVCFPSFDKNSSVYKDYKKYFVVFSKIDENSLLAYAIKKCKDNNCAIEQDKLAELIKRCDCNLGAVLNELEKIFILGQENSNVLVDYMLNNNFPDYRQKDLFDIINKILRKDFSAFKDLLKIDTSVVTIAYNMYNTSRAYLIKSRNPFYSKVMQICYEIYNGIIDGTMSTNYALQYLMFRMYS